MELTLAELLASRAEFTPEHEAFVDGGLRLTFREADHRAGVLAEQLRKHGVKRGDRVIILAKNGEFLATSFFALSRLGAIVVVANWRLPANDLGYIARDSGSTAILADDEFANTARVLADQVDDLALRVVCGAACDGELGYQDLVATDIETLPQCVGEGDDDAVIMYTSGTTGRPKGAVLTNANMFWSAQGMATTISWEGTHRFLLVAPMFHIGGLAPLVCNVLRGTTTIFLRDFDPAAVWATISAERVTTLMTVPLMLGALLKVASVTTVDTSSLVAITCGGAMVPTHLIEACAALGVPVQVVYGITEFAGSLTFWTPAMGLDHLHTQGKPVFGARIAVVETDSGRPLDVGEPGELLACGPQRFDRYWQNPDATSAAITDDGWYRTGDIALIDEQGFLHLVDRAKDVIISGGENIYPAEIENALITHPAIAEVVVTGRHDDTWGEIPIAHVVLHADAEANEAELLDYARERLAGYKRPKAIEFIDAVPKNSVGKVLRRELRA